MSRKVTIGLCGLTAAAGVLALASPSRSADPPIVARVLAAGSMHPTTVHTKAGLTVLDSITIKPGGSFGWHTHPAAVEVVVARGTLTLRDPSIRGCAAFTVPKGGAFVERANHVHLARNDTKRPVTVYAMFMGMSKNAVAVRPAEAPAGCGG